VGKLRNKGDTGQNLSELAAHGTWLAERGKSLRTCTEYRRTLGHLSRWLEARDADLLTATPDHLKAWRSGLTVEPNTVLGYITAVRSFYRWAIWAKKVAVDPSADLPLPKRRKGRPRPIPENLLVVALVNAPPMVRTWLMLAALLGLRACEIAILRREDIIEYQETRVLIVRGKGGKERIVPLRDQAWQELLLAGLPTKGWIFLRNDRRGPRNAQQVSYYANQYLHSIGIKETLHQLRHRFGTRSFAEGKDLRIVQEMMGHESPATTALYADYSRSEAILIADAIEIDLSQADGRKLPLNPPAVQVDRTPHVPVSPSVSERETPSPLRRAELAVRRFQFTEHHGTIAHDYPVRPPRRRPARVSNAVTAKTVLSLQIPDGSVQLGLSHELDLTARETPTSGARRSRRQRAHAWPGRS
jgi:integrase/recombinase XerC